MKSGVDHTGASSPNETARLNHAVAAAVVYRGEAVEAIHYASIAVVGENGELTHSLGDPHNPIIARSSIKPFQILPLFTSGAADHYGFTPRQLAIMCGSHNGSDAHREVVLSNLSLSGHTPDDLQCGCHWPMGMQIDNVYPWNGEDQDPLRHNCSGKHSGFLALAKFVGDPAADYLKPDSRTQRLVKQAVSDFCEYPIEKMPTVIDGCSAPNFPLPLRNLALAFKKLANLESPDDSIRQALSRVRDAMMEHPEMVSGEKRFDLDLMRSFPGRVVCKVGGEAIEGIGFSDPPLGIAIKIHDGNIRSLAPVCVAVLKQLGLISSIDDFPLLKKHETPLVRNARNIVTGWIVTVFELEGCSHP
jgi:L-asparaginase II